MAPLLQYKQEISCVGVLGIPPIAEEVDICENPKSLTTYDQSIEGHKLYLKQIHPLGAELIAKEFRWMEWWMDGQGDSNIPPTH